MICSRTSLSISLLKHYVIASQSERSVRGRPLYLSLGGGVIQLPGVPVARVAAIFKSGKRCDSNNYRPISVLSIFSRVFEKIVHDQLHEFLKANGISTNNQYAFRKLYFTIMSLINSTEHWPENVDNRKLNRTVFLDLKKAFDTVDHKIFIDKQFKYGINGK